VPGFAFDLVDPGDVEVRVFGWYRSVFAASLGITRSSAARPPHALDLEPDLKSLWLPDGGNFRAGVAGALDGL